MEEQEGKEDGRAVQNDTRHHPHQHASRRLVMGIAAVVLIAVGTIVWARWGEDIKEACFGEEGVCEVELVAEFATGTPMFEDEVSFTNDAPSTVEMGVLAGSVTIGPICPVTREGEPCEVIPEVYTSRVLSVQTLAGEEIRRFPLKEDGTFALLLPKGRYILTMMPLGIDSSPDLPQEVVIEQGATTSLLVAIDTGIR